MNQKEHDALADMSEKEARAWLEKEYGQVWSHDEAREEFTITGFRAPLCVAIRKSDGKEGTLLFSHDPRFYFNFR